MLPLLILLSAAHNPERPVQRCPDGSTILRTDTCLPALDHRYSLPHQPERRTTTQRWWCGTAPRPSEATVSFQQHQPTTPQGKVTQSYLLITLSVHGSPARPLLMRRVQEEVAAAPGLYSISTGCLFVRGSRAVPVLVLQFFENGRQASREIELR